MPPDDLNGSKCIGDELDDNFQQQEKADNNKKHQNLSIMEISKDSEMQSFDPMKSKEQPHNSNENLRFTVPEVELDDEAYNDHRSGGNQSSKGRFLIEEYQREDEREDEYNGRGKVVEVEKQHEAENYLPKKKIVLKRNLPPLAPAGGQHVKQENSPHNLSFNGLSQSVSQDKFKFINYRMNLKRNKTEIRGIKDSDSDSPRVESPSNKNISKEAVNYSPVKLQKKQPKDR